MSFYPDSDTLCDVMVELFRRTMATPAAVQALKQKSMVLRMVISDPALTLTVDGKSRPPRFKCDGAAAPPDAAPADAAPADLVMRMPADVLHQVWLGQIRLRDAYFGGRIELDGSMLRALGLAGLFRQVEALYPGVLHDKGLLNGR